MRIVLRRSVANSDPPLEKYPIPRGIAAGFLLGLLGMALPLTMFLGSEGLVIVTDNAAEMGLVLIVVLVFAKILATAGAISTGFIGGPIFPLFFVGGAAGTAINLIFPGIPATEAIPIILAAVVAHALTFGLGILPRQPAVKKMVEAPPVAKVQAGEKPGAAVESIDD